MRQEGKGLPGLLYPSIYIQSIVDIPLDKLKALGIKAFILDLDNTITRWNSNDLSEDVLDWFALIKREGFRACFLSNNGEHRVLQVANNLDLPYVHRAQKPRRGGFYRAMEAMGSVLEETAVIGDQIFTDILGGNRAGLYTILVNPIHRKEFMGTKFSRVMEYFVLRRIRKRN